MSSETEELQVFLKQWRNGLRERQVAHFQLSANYARYSTWLGSGAAVFAAIVGTSIISGLEKGGDQAGRIVFALLSLLSALLAALQTFLDYPKRSHEHNAAAVEFGHLRRECEIILTRNDAVEMRKRAEELRAAWGDAEKRAPSLLQTTLNRVRAEAQASASIPPRDSPTGGQLTGTTGLE